MLAAKYKRIEDYPYIRLVWENQDLIKAEKCRRDFFTLVKEFWDIIINDDPIYNWHIPYLCKFLQKQFYQVCSRSPKEKDIIINIPPGTTKSTIVTIMFPAWVWIAKLPKKEYIRYYKKVYRKEKQKNPDFKFKDLIITGKDLRFITGSYGNALSLDHSELSRDIIISDKYKRFFPEIEIRHDKSQKSNFKNNHGGTRFTTSVGSGVMGTHAHFILVDDPLDPEGGYSDADREKANRWVTGTLSTRKVDKKITVTILIMQRIHQDDPTAHLLNKKKGKIKHICLPADCNEFDNVKPKRLKKYYKKGLLDSIRLGKTEIESLRLELGPYGFAGQLGQDPKPREGGMFQRKDMEIVDVAPAGGTQWVRGWDFAGTSKEEAKKKGTKPAYSAGVKLKYCDGIFYIGHIVRERVSGRGLRSLMKNIASQDGKETLIDYPQDPGSAGKSQAQDLASYLAGYTFYYSTESGDKVLRADPVSAQSQAGNIKLVKGDWNEPFIDEVEYFPNGFKDQIDALSRAFRRVVILKNMDNDTVGAPAGVKSKNQPYPKAEE